jgi:hypothetical protein
VGLRQPVGLLQETLQCLRSACPGKPSPSLPVKQQTVQHPPNQLGLGDPELPRSRLQCPLVLLACVQLIPDHTYIMYIAECYRNLGTYCIQATPSCTTNAKVEPFEESRSWAALEELSEKVL